MIIKSILVSSSLFSVSIALADSKYPATDFQPKVVYQDTEYKYNASSSGSSSRGEVSRPDANYPAANFQPEVVYQDKNYKHVKDKVSKSVSSGASMKASSTPAETNEVATASDESSMSIMLGLLIAGVVGFMLYKKGSQPAAPARRSASRAAASNTNSEGLSGVAKYLESKSGPISSSVAKYLEERENVQVSSVSKYVARKKVSDRLAEAENISGVEKYLKDRG